MRLDKLISKSTLLSRKDAAKAIRAGRVLVDDGAVRNPAGHVKLGQTVQLDGRSLVYREHIYIMLNKPGGYVCSTSDQDNPTVLGLLPPELAARKPFACGRLDLDTTGLVLLTDDGKWAHRITSPKKDCWKTYLVGAQGELSAAAMKQLAEGVLLDGEKEPTRPAKIGPAGLPREDMAPNGLHFYSLQIQEGKYHQVKRMFAAVGNTVKALKRTAIGELHLDRGLESGQWRELEAAEVGLF